MRVSLSGAWILGFGPGGPGPPFCFARSKKHGARDTQENKNRLRSLWPPNPNPRIQAAKAEKRIFLYSLIFRRYSRYSLVLRGLLEHYKFFNSVLPILVRLVQFFVVFVGGFAARGPRENSMEQYKLYGALSCVWHA